MSCRWKARGSAEGSTRLSEEETEYLPKKDCLGRKKRAIGDLSGYAAKENVDIVSQIIHCKKSLYLLHNGVN